MKRKDGTPERAPHREYRPPRVTSFSSAELLELIGPAQGYGPASGGGDKGTGTGRGDRVLRRRMGL